MAKDLFDVVKSEQVRIPVHSRLPLAEAAEAHRRLEGRETTGATVLLP
jgi:NADPH2:quinone reductase